MTNTRREMVNRFFPVPKLLKMYYGIKVSDASWTFHCPFPDHPGQDKRKSAKYFSDTNRVYCFTEQRIYSAYDILRFNGVSDKKMLQLISPKIAEFSLLDNNQVKISSTEFMEEAARQFQKRGASVEVLNKPLKTFLKHCKTVLDEADVG